MKLLATHPTTKYGTGLGFRRASFAQWLLSKVFPYKPITSPARYWIASGTIKG